MRRLSDFGDSFIFIALGVILILITRNPGELRSENTKKIEGILKEYPEEGVHDESQNYIGLWLTDFDDFFEFSACSFNDKIKVNVKNLKPGDKVTLYVKKQSSSVTYPWKGSKYKTYTICEANSPIYGYFIKFDQYNRCAVRQANIIIPILCSILIIMGLFRFFKKLADKDNIMDTKYLDLSNVEVLSDQELFRLKPDKLAYILRNSGLPILCLVSGVILVQPFDPEYHNILGDIFIILGLIILFYYILMHDKVYYILDKDGVYLRSVSIFFQPEVVFISYQSIKEVIDKQAFYEINRKLGTIQIHDGEIYDGDKMYKTLAGIGDYERVANFIKKKANINH